MAITFYTGSGSVPGWKVHLTLEHKQIPYQLKLLSFQAREHKAAEFLAVNPRGKVPAITDGDFALRESAVIVEYLEERFPERPLLPRDPRERARLRRLAAEADAYLGAAQHEMASATFLAPAGQQDPARLASGREAASAELARHEEELRGAFFGDDLPSLADFTLYPLAAMTRRICSRFTPQPLELGARLAEWMKRIEALPYYDRTYPPHWRA